MSLSRYSVGLLLDSQRIRERQIITLWEPRREILKNTPYFWSLIFSDLLVITFNILFRSFYIYHLLIALSILIIVERKRPYNTQLVLDEGQRTITSTQNNTRIDVKKSDQLQLVIRHNTGIDKWVAYAGEYDAEVIILKLQLILVSEDHEQVLVGIKRGENYQLIKSFLKVGALVASIFKIDFSTSFDQLIEEITYELGESLEFTKDHIMELEQFGRSFERGKISIDHAQLELRQSYVGIKLFTVAMSVFFTVIGIGILALVGFLLLQVPDSDILTRHFILFISVVWISLVGVPFIIFSLQEISEQQYSDVIRFASDGVCVLRSRRSQESIVQQIPYASLNKIILIKQWYSWYRVALVSSHDIIVLKITVYKEEEGKQLLHTLNSILS